MIVERLRPVIIDRLRPVVRSLSSTLGKLERQEKRAVSNIPMWTERYGRGMNSRYRWIVRQLHARGITFGDIAGEIPIARERVGDAVVRGQVLYRDRCHRAERIESAIAAKLGMTAEELFAERYESEGE